MFGNATLPWNRRIWNAVDEVMMEGQEGILAMH